ncbi:hypothetical protein Tco_0394372 [Tanacetum coccineum]
MAVHISLDVFACINTSSCAATGRMFSAASTAAKEYVCRQNNGPSKMQLPQIITIRFSFKCTKVSDNAGQARKETEPVKDYILLPLWTANPPFAQDSKSSHDVGFKTSSDNGKKVDEDPRKDSECKDQEKEDNNPLMMKKDWVRMSSKQRRINDAIDADKKLPNAKHKNKKELSIKDKLAIFQQLLEKGRKHFAAKRVEEKRNKPPIKAQQRKILCTYLKNMEGYKLQDLKLKGFDSIQEMFEDFRTELVEGKEKRAGIELL